MCGIAAILSKTETPSQHIQTMCEVMAHRGPDNQGVYTSGKVALGHRRLAIIDLDARSNQPWVSQDGNIVLVFNGEIYNYKALKQHCPYDYQTESDTEVLLAAYLKYGEALVEYLEGMFAFVLYDKSKNLVLGARDRLGIKPLYYSETSDAVYFASELRSLQAVGIGKSLDAAALPQYLAYQHKFGTTTLVQGVHEVAPGHLFRYDLRSQELKIQPFWQLEQIATIHDTQKQAQEKIRDLLYQAVSDRLVADVPFGAFLSGGMDSSALVGIMSQLSDAPVSTFHISFQEKGFSEREHAAEIAKKWNTRHEVLEITPQEFLAQIPDAIAAYDYPGVDGINSWVISNITKKAGITMALSGAGGDELFAGYPVFSYVKNWHHYAPFRSLFSPLRWAAPLLPDTKKREQLFLSHLNQPATVMQSLFRQRLPQKSLGDLLMEIPVDAAIAPQQIAALQKKHSYTWVSQQELSTYVPSVLLRDTDQMSMAHALEIRVPFLDHRLVEYVVGLPDRLKRGKGNKPLLQAALGMELLPDSIVDRKKMGFTFPWDRWLREALRSYAESALDHLKNSPHFKTKGIEQVYQGFRKGHHSYTVILSLVILSQWMQRNHVQ